MNRTLRRPTGKPSWPIALIAGREKSGKSYQSALASASDLINDTYWVSIGEKDPDEYGAIPGARFAIAPHDGTVADIEATIQWLRTSAPKSKDKPNLLVIDSATLLWDQLSREASNAAEKRGSRDRNGELIVGTDLWNKANFQWKRLLSEVKAWDGPVIITARLETTTVMSDAGRPTTAKTEKVKSQKALPYDVDLIVEMPARGQAELVGARSVIYQLPERTALPGDWTMDWLWRSLGLAKVKTAPATHSETADAADESTPAPVAS
ncbi:hypothetical protein ASF48_05100 [Rathayibacter sp. Leaf299]|uniref:AAA family ATPase n=1 Tax=Rathayibacter sp. Leaf299 TaxID=1736328 RepID=UPI0006FE4A1C|nr:AAA family ATPase [Rathayibacter sp. Leaf299]KQQ22563.1 hypothetical protein ASF48_05100 [Rathayibacter sp. Leaf299]